MTSHETTVPHPSEFIQEELAARGWSRENLATRMGGDPEHNLLTLGLYYEVGPDQPGLLLGKETAAQLSKAFGVSAQFFLNLHSQWLAQHVH